jgi:hypothetical protein
MPSIGCTTKSSGITPRKTASKKASGPPLPRDLPAAFFLNPTRSRCSTIFVASARSFDAGSNSISPRRLARSRGRLRLRKGGCRGKRDLAGKGGRVERLPGPIECSTRRARARAIGQGRSNARPGVHALERLERARRGRRDNGFRRWRVYSGCKIDC